MAKVLTVFGATGSQGGSVVRTFLEDPKLNSEWTIRAVTRDLSSNKAKVLASQGVEVVTVRHQYHRTVSVGRLTATGQCK